MTSRRTIPWDEIKARYESGASMLELAKIYNISQGTISKRARIKSEDGWRRDREKTIARKAAKQVDKHDPKMASDRAATEGSDIETQRRIDTLDRHRREWVQVASLRQDALSHRDNDGKRNDTRCFHAMKLAKITAEMTSIQQAGERKNLSLDNFMSPDDNNVSITIKRE